ncbi:CAAX protease self-immunity [Micromonospora inyonensis]|uniref:CAAX protease self-immunity n=1 Tax=Micromonospora inyonensis TaxID=47866 RepID=A0A1C6RFU8_9ACTN|nr:CAAX protease self-immunity [Micromonospora inyonensis]
MLLVLSPLILLAAVLLGQRIAGSDWPAGGALFAISGTAAGALPVLAALVLVNGLGEEAGWLGFLQERLQRRFGPTRAALLTALVWAGWHAPLFVILESFRGFDLVTLVGFFLGMAAGALVLAYVYNRAGGSVIAAACWHAGYNLASATPAAQGLVAAVVTTGVMTAAVILLVAGLRSTRHGTPPPLLGGRPSAPDPASAQRPVHGEGPVHQAS